ncbi:MAG: peptidase domain-containing ABC transporter [Bacteroidales bacterium]|jgi:ATP-binding cassette subfamily B protein|nr:peptidase domain-containing ABC transporter [Bacteroidales bacterium]
MAENFSKFKKYHIRQHNLSDCGAVCLLSIVRYYGGNYKLSHLRQISGTTHTGTTLLGLYQAAQKLNFHVQGIEMDFEDLKKQTNPTILHCIIDGKLQHYIVCYGYIDGNFIISDPAKDVSLYSEENLSQIWTKKALLLKANEQFVSKKATNKKKILWLKQLIKDDIGILIVASLLGIIISALGLAMSIFSQKLIDDILPSKNLNSLIIGLLLVMFLLLVRLLLQTFRQKMMLIQSRNFNNRIINFFYGKLLQMSRLFFIQYNTGDITARLNDTKRIQNSLTVIFGNILTDIIIVLVSMLALLYYSGYIALFSFIALPIFFIVIYLHNKKILCQQQNVMVDYAKTENNFISSIKGIETIKNFGREDVFKSINNQLYTQYQNSIFSLGLTNIKIGVQAGLVGLLISMAIIVICSLMVFQGKITIGDTMAIISISGTIFASVANLAVVAIPINEAKVAFDRVFEIVEDENIEQNEVFSAERQMIDIHKLSLQNIDFSFAGRKKILQNVNMTFEKGKIYCIVGDTGCGKTTLFHIIRQNYPIESGKILINDMDVNDFTAKEWKNQISSVEQEVVLFSGTILDNIFLGNIPSNLDDFVEFCEEFGLNDFFAQLPQGVAGIVGENGQNLSSGQKQMLAFIRAIYKPHQILLLDETTANMDNKLEAYFIHILKKIVQNKIVIFITHKLNIAKQIADKIYDLGNV